MYSELMVSDRDLFFLLLGMAVYSAGFTFYRHFVRTLRQPDNFPAPPPPPPPKVESEPEPPPPGPSKSVYERVVGDDVL